MGGSITASTDAVLYFLFSVVPMDKICGEDPAFLVIPNSVCAWRDYCKRDLRSCVMECHHNDHCVAYSVDSVAGIRRKWQPPFWLLHVSHSDRSICAFKRNIVKRIDFAGRGECDVSNSSCMEA